MLFNSYQKILDNSTRKPNKTWIGKGSEFYNSSFKKWLKDNDIEMYSTHNEGKYVVAERFITILKNKIDKYMTAVSKNVYIDKLDDLVNEYNNTYHRTIKVRPIELKDNAYIDSIKEGSDKDAKFKVGYHVRVSKYKNIFPKGYTPIGLKKFLWLKKLKIPFHGHMLLMISMVKELLGHFTKTAKNKSEI